MKRQIVLNSQIINYELRKNKLSKHIRLTITGDKGLVVTIPHCESIQRAEKFIRDKQAWILRHLREQWNRVQAQTEFNSGDSLLLFGEEIKLLLENHLESRLSVEFDRPILRVKVPETWPADALKSGIIKALLAWYTGQAKMFIPERTAAWAKKMDLEYGRVTIKNLRSRWGSCSQLSNLNFNFRLIMAPVAVADYVIIHELCHLKELNHSFFFWQQVERFCPDYKLQKKWLREHGRKLFLF